MRSTEPGVISATEVRSRSLPIGELVPAAVVARQRKEEKLRRLNALRISKRRKGTASKRVCKSLPGSFASDRSGLSVPNSPASYNICRSEPSSNTSIDYNRDDTNDHHCNDVKQEEEEHSMYGMMDLTDSSLMSDQSNSSFLLDWSHPRTSNEKLSVLFSLLIDNHPIVLPMLRYCLPVSVGSLFGGCAGYVSHHSKNLAGIVVGACFVAAQCLQYHTSWMLNACQTRPSLMITQSTSLSLLNGWSALRNSNHRPYYRSGYTMNNYGGDSDGFIEGLFAVGSFGAAFALAVYKFPIHPRN